MPEQITSSHAVSIHASDPNTPPDPTPAPPTGPIGRFIGQQVIFPTATITASIAAAAQARADGVTDVYELAIQLGDVARFMSWEEFARRLDLPLPTE